MPENHRQQRLTYSLDYKRYGLKSQVITAPDRSIVSITEPNEGKVHDRTMFNTSGVEERLQAVFGDDNEVLYCVATPPTTTVMAILLQF